MNKFEFSRRSRASLVGVHADLVILACRAIKITTVDFVVIEGVRSAERQKELFDRGDSWTLNGRHLSGHAIDVVAWADGGMSWAWPFYYDIFSAFDAASKQTGIPFEWGGHNTTVPKDGPHYQLPRAFYQG